MRPKCPRCGSCNTLYLMYGYPTDDAFELVERGIAVFGGGCLVTGNEKDSLCGDCGKEFDGEWDLDALLEAGEPDR
ncbi:MAG: hypothetical protein GX224_06125 [Thermoplasmatales archaeon]|nr:hypothetical protein [Thermoplasmatales archaeon]